MNFDEINLMTNKVDLAHILIRNYADELYQSNPLRQNRYFVAIQNNEVSKNRFLNSQICLIHFYNHWSHILALLLSKIGKIENRLSLLNMLYEDLGKGTYDKCSVNTFYEFLISLGYDHKKGYPDSIKCIDELINYLTMLINKDKYVAIAALGIIEYAQIDINEMLTVTILEKDWIKDSSKKHYKIMDNRNANELFSIIAPHWNNYHIQFKDGLKEGLNQLHIFYDSLYEKYLIPDCSPINDLLPLNKSYPYRCPQCKKYEFHLIDGNYTCESEN